MPAGLTISKLEKLHWHFYESNFLRMHKICLNFSEELLTFVSKS